MPKTARNHEHTFTTRVVALTLLVAFVLQSAAQASEGCIARVFVGSCCCVDADSNPSAALGDEVPAARSCCATTGAEDLDERGPLAEPARACHCETAALPTLPASSRTEDGAAAREYDRVMRASAVPFVSCVVAQKCAVFRAEMVRRPPDPSRTPPRPFDHDRGNSSRMSRLCVCLR